MPRAARIRPFHAVVALAAVAAAASVATAMYSQPHLLDRLLVAPHERAADVEPSRRHVLLLTVDTLRADYLGSDGFELPTSPFLDELVARGFRFSRAATTVPRTTPALASLLTGAYPHTTKVRSLVDRLSSDVTPIAERMRRRGYRTVAVVSNHVLSPKRGLLRGFDVYDFAGDGRDARATTRDALAHLDGVDPREPVFLWVHYIDPHMPYAPSPERAREFDPGYEGRYRERFGGELGATGPSVFPTDLPKLEAIYSNPLSESVNAHVRRLYAADVRQADDGIRELFAGLESRFGEEWLVVFTADHGESLGEHDYFYEHGDFVYGPTVRVPLAVVPAAGDPLAGSGHVRDWVSVVDVVPTLAELVGLDVAERAGAAARTDQVEGVSLVPYLTGRAREPQPVFAESGKSLYPDNVARRVTFDVAGRFRTVMLDRWKLVWTPGLPRAQAYELYDVDASFDDARDLAAAEPEVVERMAALLEDWLEASDDVTATPDADDFAALRALGYIE